MAEDKTRIGIADYSVYEEPRGEVLQVEVDYDSVVAEFVEKLDSSLDVVIAQIKNSRDPIVRTGEKGILYPYI